jgi:hypothetical protein
MKPIHLFIFIIFTSCNNQTNKKEQAEEINITPQNDTSYVWRKLLDSADWNKSYNFQLFNIKDTLWAFHADGTWYSIDGYIGLNCLLPM